MNGITSLQQWQVSYLVIALLFAMAAVVVAHHLRIGDPPSVATEATAAMIAGALWPVMVLGLAQLWAILQAVTRLRASQAPPVAGAAPAEAVLAGR